MELDRNQDIENHIYAINGAAVEVHKKLGHGFAEKVYGDALAIEFRLRGIPFEREKHLVINYKGECLQHDFFVDFLCFSDIVVELKALDNLLPANTGQVLNYLKVANLRYALLYNFGEPAIKIKRIKL